MTNANISVQSRSKNLKQETLRCIQAAQDWSVHRYKDHGPYGLEDRSRRPYRHHNKLPFQIERAILRIWVVELILFSKQELSGSATATRESSSSKWI